MKPIVIISEFSLFVEQTITLYNVVKNWKDTADDSEVSRQEAYQTIKDYQLPLVYKDEFGKIYADPNDNPYMYYRKDFIKKAHPADRRRLNARRKWILEEMGGTPHRVSLWDLEKNL